MLVEPLFVKGDGHSAIRLSLNIEYRTMSYNYENLSFTGWNIGKLGLCVNPNIADLHRGKKRRLFTQGHFYLVFYSKHANNNLVFSAAGGKLPWHDT